MTRFQFAFLFGAGLPLLVAILAVADRRGLFRTDQFPTPLRKRAALGLLLLHLVATVLLPAASDGRQADTSTLRFPLVFVSQGVLAAFLAAWWLLAGRPHPVDFLRLRSRQPLAEAGAGVCLGLIGWAVTLVVGALAALVMGAFDLPAPETVPPLVRWIAGLSVLERATVVVMAMTLEEFYFRAFLQSRFGAVAASILFLLAHSGYGEPLFFVGLLGITAILAAAYRRTGSTIAPILAHGTFNAIQLFVVIPLVLRLLDAR